MLALFPSIMLPMFLAIADQTIVAAALPAIAGELGDIERLSWVVISYLVAVTITAPVYGRLGDLLGRKRLMSVALVIFTLAAILCGLSTSIEMLAVARILQGLGGGGLMTLSQALIGEAVPPRERGRYQSATATIAVTSSAFGAVAGGLLTQHFGWRSIFFVVVPVALLALYLVRRLPTRPGSGQPFRFDALGLALFAVFIASSLVMLHNVQHFEAGILMPVVVLLAVGILAVLALIWWEKRAPDPLLPIPLFRNPAIWRCDALAVCHGAMLVSLVTFVPIYFRVVHGASAGTIGVLLLPIAVGIATGSIFTGWVITRTGYTAVIPSFGLVVAVLILIAVAIFSPYLSLGQVAITLGVACLFMGTVMAVVQITVQSAAGPAMLGTASASVQFSRSLGAALGTAIVGTVLFSAVTLMDPEAVDLLKLILQAGPDALSSLPADRQIVIRSEIAGAFRAAFLTVASFGVVATLLAWSIPVRRV